ncbi:hypothetical protein ACSLNK_28515, partial [Escherichia coli]
SPAEVDALLAAAGNKQWENLFRFAIHTGLRSSELCALRWRDMGFCIEYLPFSMSGPMLFF